MISSDEIIRRACDLGYDVEVNCRKRGGKAALQRLFSIIRISATAQPGYEYVRIFHGADRATLSWIEEEEFNQRQRQEATTLGHPS